MEGPWGRDEEGESGESLVGRCAGREASDDSDGSVGGGAEESEVGGSAILKGNELN